MRRFRPVEYRPTGGHHECELFSGRRPEAEESEHNWQQCQKNPGHHKFMSPQTFTEQFLVLLPTDKQREGLKARLDLTVRLRVRYTSPERPDTDSISDLRGTNNLRSGTGFIRYVSDPEYDNPCLCDQCDTCRSDISRQNTLEAPRADGASRCLQRGKSKANQS